MFSFGFSIGDIVELTVAIMALLGVVVSAVAAIFGVIMKSFATRIYELEQDTKKLMVYNQKLWAWARTHLDLYYRYRTPESPEPTPIPHE